MVAVPNAVSQPKKADPTFTPPNASRSRAATSRRSAAGSAATSTAVVHAVTVTVDDRHGRLAAIVDAVAVTVDDRHGRLTAIVDAVAVTVDDRHGRSRGRRRRRRHGRRRCAGRRCGRRRAGSWCRLPSRVARGRGDGPPDLAGCSRVVLLVFGLRREWWREPRIYGRTARRDEALTGRAPIRGRTRERRGSGRRRATALTVRSIVHWPSTRVPT